MSPPTVYSRHRGYAAAVILVLVLTCGCAVTKTTSIIRIALLAPFEGEDQRIGYEALYAARLAFSDANDIDLELVAVDDGADQAANRAAALAADPLVKVVLWLGSQTKSDYAQASFGNLPVLIVGNWGAQKSSGGVFILSDERPPDEAFRQRYLNSGQYVPEPGSLAVPVFDAATAAIAAARSDTREDVQKLLSEQFG